MRMITEHRQERAAESAVGPVVVDALNPALNKIRGARTYSLRVKAAEGKG